MSMPARHITLPRFQVDANRINASRKLSFMNQLEKWEENGVITLDISKTAMDEAAAGSARRGRKTMGMVYSLTCSMNNNEKQQMRTISYTLFPDGCNTENERRDVEIIFNAKKYGYTLITNDGGSKRQPGGMLGNRKALKQAVGVDIVTDEEAVEMVKRKIILRDNLARQVALETGQCLPAWVEKD